MEGIQTYRQSIRYRTDQQQRRIEFQGTTYDDKSNKNINKDNLLLGGRIPHQSLFQGVLLSLEPISD